MPYIPHSNHDLIYVSESIDVLSPGTADCIFQQHSTYLNMKLNNTSSAVALVLCTVMLNEVLSLHLAFSIRQILLAVHSYSIESFRRRWGLWQLHISIWFRNN